MEFQGYGGYCLPRAMPEYSKAEGLFAELCTLAWIATIILCARTLSNPTSILFCFWTVGIFVCIPIAGWLGTRQDNKTTLWREMNYFLRRGMIGFRIVFWPVTLLLAYFQESERSSYLSDLWFQFQKKHWTANRDTLREMADTRTLEIDRGCDEVQTTAVHALEIATEVPALACRTGAIAATLAGAMHAQTPVTTVVITRTGQNLQAPYTSTYHLFEVLQVRGKWIFPDVGYVDFATGNYREVFIGGGRTFHDGKRLSVTGELYFVQAAGPASQNARYLWPNAIVDFRFTPKLTSQTSYILYAPLNKSARIQQVIERSKLEYAPKKSWKFGGGYAAYQYGNGPWQSKLFATTTISTKAGSFEFWLQKIQQGGQVQMRYSFAHTSRR